MSAAISNDKPRATLDRALVQSLAREYGQPEPEIERILTEELSRLAADARISAFVGVLATSSARMRLKRGDVNRH